MKKIYSFMLMATMLLIGINANAVEVSTAAELQTALNDNDRIELGANIKLGLQESFYFYRAIDDSVVLDLKGHTIDVNTSETTDTKKVAYGMFHIYRGHLTIISTEGKGTIKCEAVPNYNIGRTVFRVYGTARQLTKHTGLLIDENVLVQCNVIGASKYKAQSNPTVYRDTAVVRGYGIQVVEMRNAVNYNRPYKFADGTTGVNIPDYITILSGSDGLANGVNIEVKGEIEASRYCININGNVRSPQWLKDKGVTTYSVAEGTDSYGPFTLNDDAYQYTPYIHIAHSAVLTGMSDYEGSATIYTSGYGRWLIEGTATGNVALYVKSGSVELSNATIHSDANTYTPVAGDRGSGIDAAGSAVILESSANYSGDISVNVTNGTSISAEAGCAFEEVVTSATTESKVDLINITSGTLQAGNDENASCLVISTSTTTKAEAAQTTLTIGGGTYGTGINNDDDDTQALIAYILNLNSEDGFATQTVNEVGNPVVVITTNVEEPQAVVDINTTTESSVDLSNLGEQKLGKEGYEGIEKEIDFLRINGDGSIEENTLVIANGASLTVGQIVLGEKARLIVEPQGKLILTSNQGITVNNKDNLVLQADQEHQALFAISPLVTSNNQPKATVELYTVGRMAGTSSRVYQAMASPMAAIDNVKSNYIDKGSPELAPGATTFTTYFLYYNVATETWDGLTAINQFRPFVGYFMDNTSKDGGITYSFAGNLQGNVANITLPNAEFNYLSNSFTAPAHAKSLLQAVAAQNAARGEEDPVIGEYVYYWNINAQKYETASLLLMNLGISPSNLAIPSLTPFVLFADGPATIDINYTNTVYNYALNPTSANYSAPARRNAVADNTFFAVNVQDANGQEDGIYMLEDAQFSAEYENGADIEKLMNENINLYIDGEKNLAMMASDELEGATLSLQTKAAAQYTLTFQNVNGKEFALRDNMTGAVVAIKNGATYNFVAQPNSIQEARFEIIEAAKMPTDVEMLEAAPAKKGIFSLQGQYLGEDLRVLPAGIYVVNGQKIVK